MIKKLLFEGAGMDYEVNEESNVGNYRIRTSFLDNKNKAIYLELGGHEFETGKGKKKVKAWRAHVDFVFNIIETEKDTKYLYPENNMIGYTKEEITRWVNKTFDCNFDTIEVLDFMEGYRVHKDTKGYNLMNDHIVNRERTIARKEAYKKIDMEFRNKLNEKYSVLTLLETNENNIVVRCHAAKEHLQKVGLTNKDRTQTIAINY